VPLPFDSFCCLKYLLERSNKELAFFSAAVANSAHFNPAETGLTSAFFPSLATFSSGFVGSSRLVSRI